MPLPAAGAARLTPQARRKLQLLEPALRRALEQAERRARRHQLELRCERVLDQVCNALARATVLGELLSLCLACREKAGTDEAEAFACPEKETPALGA